MDLRISKFNRHAYRTAYRTELLRRAQIVLKAINLLAKLRAKIANKNGKANAVAATASLRLAMSYLMDDAVLRALLDDLEGALEHCEAEIGATDYLQALMIVQDAAAFKSQNLQEASVQSYLI